MPISVSDLLPAPRTPGERLQRLFQAHAKLKEGYGQAYRNIKSILEVIRNAQTSDTSDDPDAMTPEAKEKLESELLDLRKRTVLDFKRSIKIVELAINELVPNTFDHNNEPLQSDDRDKEDLKDDLTALAAAAGGIAAAAALVPGGQGVAAFSAGFAAGVLVGIAALEIADEI
jgi:hypothetical protein